MINESMNHHHPTGNGNESMSVRTGRKIHELERGASKMMMSHSMRDGSVWRNLVCTHITMLRHLFWSITLNTAGIITEAYGSLVFVFLPH